MVHVDKIRRTFLLTTSINVYFLVLSDKYFVLTKHLFSMSDFTIVLFQYFIVVVNIVCSTITTYNVKKETSYVSECQLRTSLTQIC